MLWFQMYKIILCLIIFVQETCRLSGIFIKAIHLWLNKTSLFWNRHMFSEKVNTLHHYSLITTKIIKCYSYAYYGQNTVAERVCYSKTEYHLFGEKVKLHNVLWGKGKNSKDWLIMKQDNLKLVQIETLVLQ